MMDFESKSSSKLKGGGNYLEELEVSHVMLTEDYRITTDKMNIILQEKYAKRAGKGKNAPLSGEYGWKDVGYYSSLEGLAYRLVEREIINFDATKLDDLLNKAQQLKEDVAKYLVEHVTVAREGKKLMKEEESNETGDEE